MNKIGILFLRCFVLSILVSHIQCKDEIQYIRGSGLKTSDPKPSLMREKRNSGSGNFILPFGGTPQEFLHPEGEFLAGEDTPVWIAHRPNDLQPVTYTRLRKGAVKRAIAYWKTVHTEGFSHRTRRSSDDNKYSTYNIEERRRIRNIRETAQQLVNLTTSKRSHDSSKHLLEKRTTRIIRPTILVTTDFNEEWPNDEVDRKLYIKEKILYVLAFWNGVDLQLRHIKNPKVFLRLAGIVIGQNKAATPYVLKSAVWDEISIETAADLMSKYWISLTAGNTEFTTKAFDFVATLTDTAVVKTTVSIQGFSTYGPPCHYNKQRIFISLISDNGGFSGLQTAVHETAHGLGAQYTNYADNCPDKENTVMAADYRYIGRKWTECWLTNIEERFLRCRDEMSVANVYYPPGKPVETILPGLFHRAKAQCQSRGWKDGYVCWSKLSCNNLVCANDNAFSRCADTFPPMDGTTCGVNNTICLDQTCIHMPQVTSNN